MSWTEAKKIIGEDRLLIGPQMTQQFQDAPDHLAMVLARYRAAKALIGNARNVVEVGCGEGIGAGILAKKAVYLGVDLDTDALSVAREINPPRDGLRYNPVLPEAPYDYSPNSAWDSVVALDVIEHIPPEDEHRFIQALKMTIHPMRGLCVIGTPNKSFEHLASPQSRAGHVNLYTHERLYELMRMKFQVVQSFGMQDTALHIGHPDARHYLLMVGIGVRW